MNFRTQTVTRSTVAQTAADALVVIVAGDGPHPALDDGLAQALKAVQASGDFQPKAGRTLCVLQPAGVRAPRLLWVGAANDGAKAVRAAVVQAVQALKQTGVKHVAVYNATGSGGRAELAEALALAVQDATYVYRHTKPSAPAAPALARVSWLVEKAQLKSAQEGLTRGSAIAAGVELARECANRPGNHATPTFLAEQARRLARSHGLKAEVLDQKAVEKLGMGAFLAVARGSAEPLRFIVLRYEGAPRTQAPQVLVGKGITFDSCGISIKPSAEMDEMKFDMSGAASVLGTLRAIAELKPRLNVIGVIPACENLPDARAVKPGDVVTSLSGQTIEILNTDAEGRLVLCDALTYVERFKPAAVIDIATLTGACVIALGAQHSGLFSPDDELAAALQDAGRRALDTCWRMPLDDEYEEALKSHFADMGNVGGRAGGAITAAIFLRKFTKAYRWAHLDIAGTAWKGGAAKGGTGRPVGLLTHYLLGQAG